MPAQNPELNRRQGIPFLDSGRIVFMEQLQDKRFDFFGEMAVHHKSPHKVFRSIRALTICRHLDAGDRVCQAARSFRVRACRKFDWDSQGPSNPTCVSDHQKAFGLGSEDSASEVNRRDRPICRIQVVLHDTGGQTKHDVRGRMAEQVDECAHTSDRHKGVPKAPAALEIVGSSESWLFPELKDSCGRRVGAVRERLDRFYPAVFRLWISRFGAYKQSRSEKRLRHYSDSRRGGSRQLLRDLSHEASVWRWQSRRLFRDSPAARRRPWVTNREAPASRMLHAFLLTTVIILFASNSGLCVGVSASTESHRPAFDRTVLDVRRPLSSLSKTEGVFRRPLQPRRSPQNRPLMVTSKPANGDTQEQLLFSLPVRGPARDFCRVRRILS